MNILKICTHNSEKVVYIVLNSILAFNYDKESNTTKIRTTDCVYVVDGDICKNLVKFIITTTSGSLGSL